jgi:hypothetical protein
MPPIIHALSLPQWGLESVKAPGTPGAAVAATKKIAVKDFLIRPTDDIFRDGSPLNGLVIANRGGEVTMGRGVEWEVPETPLNLDEMHYWLAMAIVGGVVGVGTPLVVYTYTLNPLSLGVGRDMRTIEFGMSDGAGNNSDWEIPACLLTEIEWVGAANQLVTFNSRGVGRRLQSSTRTAALAMFPINGISTALTSVFIDDTWAGRGVTQVAGQVTGWRFKLMTGLFGQRTLDARTDLDYALAMINPENVRWEIELDVKALAASAIWQTEKTAAETMPGGLLRAVEIRGAITIGALAYNFKIQAMAKHTAASVFPVDRQDGEVMGKLVLEGSTDLTNALAIIVSNAQTAAVA